MATANRILKNTAFLYMKMGITMFISLYTTRLILNALGASDFGIFNIVGGAIAMLGFLNGALAGATQRFMSYAEGEGNEQNKIKIFNASIILHLGISIIVGIILEIAAIFFFNGILSIPENRIYSAKVIYHCAVLATMFTIQTVPYDAIMNAHENMLYYAIIGIFESLLKLITALIVVHASADKLIIYGILMALISLIIQSIMRIYCHQNYAECQLNFRKYFDKRISLQMTTFAGWNATSSISTIVSQYGLGIVLNHFFGTIVNAAQGITNQISGQFGALSTNATKALNPVIVKSAGARNYDQMYKACTFGSKVLFFITSVCFLPILTNVKPILTVWLKSVPEYTYTFVSLYLFVNIIDTIAICLPTAISGVGNIKKFQLSLSYITIIPFIGSMILFSLGFPPYYVYILMMIASIFKLLSRIYYAKLICGFSLKSLLVNDVLRTVSAFIIAFTVWYFLNPYFTQNHNLVFLLFIIILNVISYGLLFYLIGFNKYDKSYILSLLKNLINRIFRTELKGK